MLHLLVVLTAQCADRSLISYLQAADQGVYEQQTVVQAV